MLTEKDYCDYETCVALKELGFNTLVDWYFNENKIIVSPLARCRSTSIPRISLYEAQKWLREKKGIVVLVHHLMTEEGDWEWEISYRYSSKVMYHSYEEALSEGIKEVVKISK